MWLIKGMAMTFSTQNIGRNTFKMAVLATAGLFMSACGTTYENPGPSIARHQIQVAESIERLELYPQGNGLVMSARDRQAMMQFLSGYGREGQGPIYMNRPEGAGGGVGQAASQVRQALSQMGMSHVAVQEGSYPSQAGAPAPVVVSYRRLKALVPDCRMGDEIQDTSFNSPSPNWGCSYYANIAAQVADPNQFLAPYGSTDPNMQRRMVVYEKYIEGDITGASRNPDQRVSTEDTQGGNGG